MTRYPLLAVLALAPVASAADPSFSADVAPVLANRCLSCHSGQKARGGYHANTFAELLTAGKSGETPVTPGKPESSELYLRLVDSDPAVRMPPDDTPLSVAEIAAVRKWIESGAKFDGPDRAAAVKSYLPPRVHPASPEKYPRAFPIFALAFAPDGSELAVGGINEVTVWNAKTGKLARRLPGFPDRIQALGYSVDGKRLLVAGGTPGEYGEVAIADPSQPGPRRVLGVFDDIVLGAGFSADESTVAAGGADRTVRAYATADGKERWRAGFHADWVTGVAFSPDGKYVASSSKDRTVKVLEAGTGKIYTTYNGHRRQFGSHTGLFEVSAVAFDSAGNAYSAGAGNAIRVWEPEKAHDENGSAIDMEARFAKDGHTKYLDYASPRPVFALAVAGGKVYAAAGDGKVREHDPAAKKPTREYLGSTDWLYCVAAHPKSNRVAAAGFDGTVRVWHAATGELETTVSPAAVLK